MSIMRSRWCVGDVDDGDPTGELAREHRRAAVGGEVGVVDARAVRGRQGVLHRPGVRVVEHQLAVCLGDRHRRAAVRGEVEVVRVGHRDRRPGRAGGRVEGGQPIPLVVAGVERAHVPRRHDVLQLARAQRVPGHHGERARVDHPHVAGPGVRDVDQRFRRPGRLGQHPRPGRGVHIVRVGDRRHPRQAVDRRGRRCGGGRSAGRRGDRRSRRRGNRRRRGRLAAGGVEQQGHGGRETCCRGADRHGCSFHENRVPAVTGVRPRPARSSRTPGSASAVPGCPRCRLTTAPAVTSRTARRTAAGPGSVKSRESTS